MKRFGLLLALLLYLADPSLAQDPNFSITFTLNSSDQIGPNPNNYFDLRGTGVTYITFKWWTNGTVSAGACALQGGTDAVTFGTTIIAAETVTSSGGPATIAGGVTSNYARINCTTPIVGSGSVQIRVIGWISNPTTTVTVSGTIDENLKQVNGQTVNVGTGNAGTGTQRVAVASDSALNMATIGGSAIALGLSAAGSSIPVVTAYGTLQSGAVTSAMTSTTSTSVIAGVASNYLYIRWCVTSNSSISVSTDMNLQDGSGGTTIAVLLAPQGSPTGTGTGTNGGTYVFPEPLKVPTLGNGLFVANVTTGSSTKITCGGFSSTVSY